MDVVRGRLLDRSSAPEKGERFEELATFHNLVVEQILSGEVEPTEYVQDQDEWVLVLDGAATIELDGQSHDLGPGDWILLPARIPHRVTYVTPGTNWLALHLHPQP